MTTDLDQLSVEKRRNKLYCQIAGLNYEIEYEYPFAKEMFEDYIIPEREAKKSDEIIQISCTDKEQNVWVERLGLEVSDYYKEYGCIMSKMAAMFPDYGMLFMHGATIEFNGKAYVFTAPSGTGKTTHISLWKKFLGDNVRVINGDKPVVSFDEDKVYVHGTPWAGKERWQINTNAPLAGVCVVERGKTNEIKRINPGEHLEVFLRQLGMAKGDDALLKVIDLFSKMAERVSFYKLTCDISEEAAKCSFEMMTGKDWESSKNEN